MGPAHRSSSGGCKPLRARSICIASPSAHGIFLRGLIFCLKRNLWCASLTCLQKEDTRAPRWTSVFLLSTYLYVQAHTHTDKLSLSVCIYTYICGFTFIFTPGVQMRPMSMKFKYLTPHYHLLTLFPLFFFSLQREENTMSGKTISNKLREG